MLYYAKFFVWIQSVPMEKLKFMDEVHFLSKGNEINKSTNVVDLARRRGISPIGQPVFVIRSTDPREAINVTCAISSNPVNPLFFIPRKHSNTQWDFLEFILAAVVEKFLVRGDYLVLDNATVHSGASTLPIVHAVLESLGIQMVYLPSYSPELNPIELFFGIIKREMRETYDPDVSLFVNAMKAISVAKHKDMSKLYRKCLE